ncbi:MAG: hypothetical protein JW966_05665 [Anaerolineae bacterium]|nr:hypothetical protein [Anaerolineae bacterium]
MRRVTVGVGLVVMLFSVVGLGVWNRSMPRVDAYDVSSVMIERLRQNQAEWTVASATFQSAYPNGFIFEIDASSSGGAIVSAQVEWVHRAVTRTDLPNFVRRADGEIDPETGLITAVWTPRGATAVPPWVGVRYHWVLRDEAGNEFETEEAFAEYEDVSRQWIRAESDEVIVFSTGLSPDVGELVVQAMAYQRQKYVDGWGEQLPYRPRVILFGDFDTWLEWQVGHQDTTGLGVVAVGMTSGVWGGTVQVVFGSEEEMAYGTVLHEVEHMYQQEYLAKRLSFTPGWFIEGDATFYQEEDMSFAVNYVQNLVRNDDLPVLLQGDGPTTGGEDALHGYYMGYMFFKWVDENWGIEAHREIMDLLAQNLPFFDVLEQVIGLDVMTMESQWRVWLGASPDVPTLIPTWTPLPFLEPPTPMQFGNN